MKGKFDYRHIICITITLGFVACSVFVFPHSFGRLIESLRDIGLSVAYYFCELLGIEYNFTPSVNDMPKYPFFDFLNGYDSPVSSLPETLDGFKDKFILYWQLWASKSNIIGYLNFYVKIFYYLCNFLLFAGIPIAILIFISVKAQLNRFNNDYAAETKALKIFKRISDYTYRPVKAWLSGFVSFIRARKGYWITWVCMWLYNFNIFTILIEFIAFYLYFVFSFDIRSVYIQVCKLFLDLWTVINFIPTVCWGIIALIILNAISIKIGYARLRHNERCNRAFLNDRGVVNTIFGYVGSGKTSLASDIALSDEVQLLDDAFKVILETDLRYPNFPWISFENALKQALPGISDVFHCRKWVRERRDEWLKDKTHEKIFGFDYERYSLEYDNKLYIQDIWKALEDYACAYMIYTLQSSYIISNYSIRSDKLKSDLGNFPVWNTDFFSRDSRLIDSFSRHSHILDFDMLRLGEIMLKNNPNRNAFGFGVYVISEVDKERKNFAELQEVKRNDKNKSGEIICNQKNDLFNACLKMSRHACVIANRVFVRVVCDLQRTGSLNSDMLELGDKIEVYSRKEMKTVLPFFSPFYVIAIIHDFLYGKFIEPYTQYRYMRSDTTLLLYIVKGVIAKLEKYYDGVTNLFGSEVVHLRVARGLQDGEVNDCRWYRMPKKIYSKRFSTDCLSGIFEARSEQNTVSIEQLAEYADIMATNDELLKQHSHFQNDINKLSPQ